MHGMSNIKNKKLNMVDVVVVVAADLVLVAV